MFKTAVVWKRFLFLIFVDRRSLAARVATSRTPCGSKAEPNQDFDFRASSFDADISFLRSRNFYISTEESCGVPLQRAREVPSSLKTKKILLEQRFAVKQLKEGLQGVMKQNFAALSNLGSGYFKRDNETSKAPAVELQMYPVNPRDAASPWKALVVPRMREVFDQKFFLCEESQCVAEVHFEKLPFRFFSLLRQWQPGLERMRSYHHFLVIFAELTFIAGAVVLLAIVGYTAYFFWSREAEGPKFERFSAKSYRLLRRVLIYDAPAGRVTDQALEAGAEIQVQGVEIEVGAGLFGAQKYWMMLWALLGYGPPGVWANLESPKGWILIADADGNPGVCDGELPPTNFVPSEKLLPNLFAFCRGCLILATSYVSSLYFLVQLEGANDALFGFCLMLLGVHGLVLHQKLSSFTIGLWHAEALDEGKLLSIPSWNHWVWAIFGGLGAPLLLGTVWIAFARRRAATAAVLTLLAAGALHALQLYSTLSGREKWREPQLRCEEFHVVRSELLPHATEFPGRLSPPKLSKLVFVRCFMACLSIGAASLLGLVTLDGCQVHGELVDYSFNRGYLVYPSEGQAFHNTLVLDATVDSLVMTLEAGRNTLGIQLEVDHPLLPQNKSFYPMGTDKSGDFQVFLPAGPLYGRISVIAVGHHVNRTYVFHTLRAGASTRIKLQGSFSKEKYPNLTRGFEEQRRLQYLQTHPKWFVPDLDRKANLTLQAQFAPVIYAPFVVTPGHSDTLVFAETCECGAEKAGFGNSCELEETIVLANGSTRCLFLRSTVSSMKLLQHGSISGENSAMAEWLTGLNISGKSAAFLPWAEDGGQEHAVFFKPNPDETSQQKRRLSNFFRLSLEAGKFLNKPSQIILALVSDPTDAEAKSTPLQVVAHAPPVRLGPADHLKNLLPTFDEEGPWEYAYCNFLNFDKIQGVVEDRRFDVRVDDHSGGSDCHGHGTRWKEFRVYRNDSDCGEWCDLYPPWAEAYDLSVVRSPERCLRDAVSANDGEAIRRIVKWLDHSSGKCFQKLGSLQEAIRQERLPAFRALLDNKADPNQISSMGETPLGVAAMEGHMKALKLLLDKKASIDQPDNSGETALFGAAKHCQVETVKLLLDLGSDVNIQSKKSVLGRCKATPLVAAFIDRARESKGCRVAGAFEEVVRLLKDRGARLKASASCDYTEPAIEATLEREDLDALRLLLDGAESLDTEEPMTVLVETRLSSAFRVQALKMLVGKGADINGTGEVIPLIEFADQCEAELVKTCLELHADPAVQDTDYAGKPFNASQAAEHCQNGAEISALLTPS